MDKHYLADLESYGVSIVLSKFIEQGSTSTLRKLIDDSGWNEVILKPYGRVDLVRDNRGNLAVMELELIEPELWLRNHPPAATAFAEAIANIVRDSPA